LIEPPAGDLKARLMNLVARMEEPIGDSVCLLQDQLFAQARTRGKSALSGEGADEMFCGYGHHYALWLWSRLRFPARAAAHLLPAGLLRAINPYPEKIDDGTLENLRGLFKKGTFGDIYSYLASTLRDDEIEALLGEGTDPGRALRAVKSLEELWQFEQRHWLANYSLLRVDKLSMSRGLEVRVPYVSPPVREIGRKNISRQFGWGRQKAVFRRALAPHLEKSYRQRKKHPFSLFSTHPLTTELVLLAEATLNEPRSLNRQCWQKGGMQAVLNNAPSVFHAKKMVNLLMLELWMRIHLDGEPVLQLPE
jgi:asparagine synthase (glutamine-hydrolysing)